MNEQKKTKQTKGTLANSLLHCSTHATTGRHNRFVGVASQAKAAVPVSINVPLLGHLIV